MPWKLYDQQSEGGREGGREGELMIRKKVRMG